MDVEDCSSKDEMITYIELLSMNRRRRRRLARKFKELAAKDESLKAKKLEEQYCRDTTDQKISTLTFTGKDSRNMFREDLRTETITYRN